MRHLPFQIYRVKHPKDKGGDGNNGGAAIQGNVIINGATVEATGGRGGDGNKGEAGEDGEPGAPQR